MMTTDQEELPLLGVFNMFHTLDFEQELANIVLRTMSVLNLSFFPHSLPTRIDDLATVWKTLCIEQTEFLFKAIFETPHPVELLQLLLQRVAFFTPEKIKLGISLAITTQNTDALACFLPPPPPSENNTSSKYSAPGTLQFAVQSAFQKNGHELIIKAFQQDKPELFALVKSRIAWKYASECWNILANYGCETLDACLVETAFSCGAIPNKNFFLPLAHAVHSVLENSNLSPREKTLEMERAERILLFLLKSSSQSPPRVPDRLFEILLPALLDPRKIWHASNQCVFEFFSSPREFPPAFERLLLHLVHAGIHVPVNVLCHALQYGLLEFVTQCLLRFEYTPSLFLHEHVFVFGNTDTMDIVFENLPNHADFFSRHWEGVSFGVLGFSGRLQPLEYLATRHLTLPSQKQKFVEILNTCKVLQYCLTGVAKPAVEASRLQVLQFFLDCGVRVDEFVWDSLACRKPLAFFRLLLSAALRQGSFFPIQDSMLRHVLFSPKTHTSRLPIYLEQTNKSLRDNQDKLLTMAIQCRCAKPAQWIASKYDPQELKDLFDANPSGLLQSYASIQPEFLMGEKQDFALDIKPFFLPPTEMDPDMFLDPKTLDYSACKFFLVGLVLFVFNTKTKHVSIAIRQGGSKFEFSISFVKVDVERFILKHEEVEDVVGIGHRYLALLTRSKLRWVDRRIKILKLHALLPYTTPLAHPSTTILGLYLNVVQRDFIKSKRPLARVLVSSSRLRTLDSLDKASLVCMGNQMVCVGGVSPQEICRFNPFSFLIAEERRRNPDLLNRVVYIPLPSKLVSRQDRFDFSSLGHKLVMEMAHPDTIPLELDLERLKPFCKNDAQLCAPMRARLVVADTAKEENMQIILPNTASTFGRAHLCFSPTRKERLLVATTYTDTPMQEYFDIVRLYYDMEISCLGSISCLDSFHSVRERARQVVCRVHDQVMLNNEATRLLQRVYAQEHPDWHPGIKRVYRGKHFLRDTRPLPPSVLEMQILKYESACKANRAKKVQGSNSLFCMENVHVEVLEIEKIKTEKKE